MGLPAALHPQEARSCARRTCCALYRPLGKRLLASPLVSARWSFNFRLSHEKENLLQGVMDCAFREGDGWVLLDYKTDRVEDLMAFVAATRPSCGSMPRPWGRSPPCPCGKCGSTPWATAKPIPCRPGMPRRRNPSALRAFDRVIPRCIITYPRFAVAGKTARVRTGAGFSCIPGV